MNLALKFATIKIYSSKFIVLMYVLFIVSSGRFFFFAILSFFMMDKN